jgi:hypothetical protein
MYYIVDVLLLYFRFSGMTLFDATDVTLPIVSTCRCMASISPANTSTSTTKSGGDVKEHETSKEDMSNISVNDAPEWMNTSQPLSDHYLSMVPVPLSSLQIGDIIVANNRLCSVCYTLSRLQFD